MSLPTPQVFNSREIFVNEIVLHDRTDAYLFGFVQQQGNYCETQFVIGRKLLHKLLLLNGKKGEQIVHYLKQAELHPHAVPISADLVELFGTTVPLQADAIQLQIPFVKNADGELEPVQNSELLFVDAIKVSKQ